MKLVSIDKIPPAPKKKLQKLISDFVNSGEYLQEVVYEPGEYCSNHSCYSSFYKAARISGYRVAVVGIGGRTFLVNRALAMQHFLSANGGSIKCS